MARGPELNVMLTPAQHRQLLAAESEIAAARDLLDRAERAGLDVADARAELERRDAIRRGLLEQFAPGASPSRT